MTFINLSDVIVGEGDGVARFTVRLTEAASETVSVDYAPVNQTAANGSDFNLDPGTLTFAPGETVKEISVGLRDVDSSGEATETFLLRLSNPQGAMLATSDAVGVILDTPRSMVEAPGVSVQDVVVDETAEVARFVVRLEGVSASLVTVDYATANASAMAGSDFEATSGNLRFLPGEIVKTVEVPIIDDAAAEGVERFALSLSNVVGGTPAQSSATATVFDNDAAPAASPAINVSDAVVGEGDGVARFTVRLSAPSEDPVSVAFDAVNETAANGSDFNLSPGVLTFAPGEVVKEVVVGLRDVDSQSEATETFALRLRNPDGGTLADADAIGVILDNNTTGEAFPAVANNATTAVGESAAFVDVPVTLAAPAADTLFLAYETEDGSATAGQDYEDVSGTLAFLPGEVVRTIRIPVLDDNRDEASERFDVVFSPVDGAASPPGASFRQTLTIEDDDGANPGFTGTPGDDGLFDQQEIALLYEAALGRQPDLPGLNFWINEVYDDGGLSVLQIAEFFYDSDELEDQIGADPDTLDNAGIVETFYSNVLDREGLASENDPDGFAFWLGLVNEGLGRDELIRFFAISEENVENSPYVFDLAQGGDGGWSF